MLMKLKKILVMLSFVVLAPEAVAHTGVHGTNGLIATVLHQLTAVDHWLILLVLCLFAGLFISSARRS